MNSLTVKDVCEWKLKGLSPETLEYLTTLLDDEVKGTCFQDKQSNTEYVDTIKRILIRDSFKDAQEEELEVLSKEIVWMLHVLHAPGFELEVHSDASNSKSTKPEKEKKEKKPRPLRDASGKKIKGKSLVNMLTYIYVHINKYLQGIHIQTKLCEVKVTIIVKHKQEMLR